MNFFSLVKSGTVTEASKAEFANVELLLVAAVVVELKRGLKLEE